MGGHLDKESGQVLTVLGMTATATEVVVWLPELAAAETVSQSSTVT